MFTKTSRSCVCAPCSIYTAECRYEKELTLPQPFVLMIILAASAASAQEPKSSKKAPWVDVRAVAGDTGRQPRGTECALCESMMQSWLLKLSNYDAPATQ